MKQTALHQAHLDAGARMVPFAGYDMPVQYAGIVEEHMAVRTAVGMFDVSHMGEVFVEGPHAEAFLQALITNDVSKLEDGKVLYSVMCNAAGGVVDDLLVYRVTAEQFLVVINAANIEKDVAWMHERNDVGATLRDESEAWSLIAVQGPTALDTVSALSGFDCHALSYYTFAEVGAGVLPGADRGYIARTGYTGEQGLELYVPNAAAPVIWKALLDAGAVPCGLGARDTLRLEAGMSLYGQDLSDTISPLEANLGWVVKMKKDDFFGKAALETQKANGLPRKLVGFVVEDRLVARPGYPVLDAQGVTVGTVTSGGPSPIRKENIGLALVPNEPAFTEMGAELTIGVRAKTITGRVVKPPFVETRR